MPAHQVLALALHHLEVKEGGREGGGGRGEGRGERGTAGSAGTASAGYVCVCV
jgi:hypothetical protein